MASAWNLARFGLIRRYLSTFARCALIWRWMTFRSVALSSLGVSTGAGSATLKVSSMSFRPILRRRIGDHVGADVIPLLSKDERQREIATPASVIIDAGRPRRAPL